MKYLVLSSLFLSFLVPQFSHADTFSTCVNSSHDPATSGPFQNMDCVSYSDIAPTIMVATTSPDLFVSSFSVPITAFTLYTVPNLCNGWSDGSGYNFDIESYYVQDTCGQGHYILTSTIGTQSFVSQDIWLKDYQFYLTDPFNSSSMATSTVVLTGASVDSLNVLLASLLFVAVFFGLVYYFRRRR